LPFWAIHLPLPLVWHFQSMGCKGSKSSQVQQPCDAKNRGLVPAEAAPITNQTLLAKANGTTKAADFVEDCTTTREAAHDEKIKDHSSLPALPTDLPDAFSTPRLHTADGLRNTGNSDGSGCLAAEDDHQSVPEPEAEMSSRKDAVEDPDERKETAVEELPEKEPAALHKEVSSAEQPEKAKQIEEDNVEEPDWMSAAKHWVAKRKDVDSDEPWKAETEKWLEERRAGAGVPVQSPMVLGDEAKPKSLLWCCYPKNAEGIEKLSICAA